jgi:predicted enzyme related to lactoylglutathione lyase
MRRSQAEWLGSAPTPAMEVKGVGRFAHLQDPQGAVFAVIARPRP